MARENAETAGEGRKIRLLVCFIHVHLGGAMTSLVNFVNALDTRRYEVDVLFYENQAGRCGIKPEINLLPQAKIHQKYSVRNVLRKAADPSYLVSFARSLYYKKIRKNRRKAFQLMSKCGCKYSRKLDREYDIAIAYELNWPLNYVMTQVKAKKKILWHHVEYEKSGMDFRIDRKSFDRADALVFVSEECRRHYVQQHPEHAKKAYFIPNLLSTAYVRQRAEERVELPFPLRAEDLTFLTVARISFEPKGLDRAVRAFARLRREGLLENVRWLIIGKGRDLPALQDMIAQEGLQDVIYPIGARENPIPFYGLCDVFLLPSRHEGKPMAVTEAFMMGAVPVVTEYTSARGQIEDGVDGLVFENSDEGLYQGLRRLLTHREMIPPMKETILGRNYGNEDEIRAFDALVDQLL